MNHSSVSDQDQSMPVFFTGCVSPEVKSQTPEKTPTVSLSPKDFENIKQSVDTLLLSTSYSDPSKNQNSPGTTPIQGRSLLPLPPDGNVRNLNGKELFGASVEPFKQTVKEDFPKNFNTSSHSKIRRAKRLFPDRRDDNRSIATNVPLEPYYVETSSPYISNSSYLSSPTASTSSNPNFYDDDIGNFPSFSSDDHHVQPVENLPGSRKRKVLLPHPEERCNKLMRPSFPPSNVWEQLSKDIWSLYHRNKQSSEVLQKKMILREKLHDILRSTFPTCGLYVVGSSMTGLGGNSSDMDMCLMVSHEEVDQKAEAISFLHAASNTLYKYDFIRSIQLIPAKVPILKFRDTISCIDVDLNVNNSVGIRNTQLLNSYSRIDKRVPPLVILVKMWARQHNINDAKHNTLSSYSLVLMVIHFLQYGCSPPVVPCLQQMQPNKFYPDSDVRTLLICEEMPNFVSENGQSVGQLFLGFLNYFANEFNFTTNAISIREGCVIPKDIAMNVTSPKNKKAHWKYVCIEEPFELTNTACSVFKDTSFFCIRNVFQKCWNMLNKNKRLRDVLRFNI